MVNNDGWQSTNHHITILPTILRLLRSINQAIFNRPMTVGTGDLVTGDRHRGAIRVRWMDGAVDPRCEKPPATGAFCSQQTTKKSVVWFVFLIHYQLIYVHSVYYNLYYRHKVKLSATDSLPADQLWINGSCSKQRQLHQNSPLWDGGALGQAGPDADTGDMCVPSVVVIFNSYISDCFSSH